MTSSPSTQDADLIAEIEKRQDEPDCEFAAMPREMMIRALHTLYNDRATLLKLLKSRQPHVTLTEDEICELKAIAARDPMIVHGPGDPFVRIGTSEHKAIRAIIDRLCLTKAESE